MTARSVGAALVVVVLLGAVGGCGGEGGEDGARPTITASISPSRTLPTPTRTPIRTTAPTDDPDTEPTTGPTRTPTTEPTTEPPPTTPPTTPPTADPTTDPTDPTEEPTTEGTTEATQDAAGPAVTATTPAATASQAADEDAADEESDAWLWWVLAGLVLAAAILTILLVVRHRRQGWRQRLGHAEAEIAWLARELLPQLRYTGSIAGVTGGWQVAEPRVLAAEDELTVLESTAGDEHDATRARDLRDAVRDVRTRIRALAAADPTEPWVLTIDEGIGTLEHALALPAPPSGSTDS